MPDVGLHTCVAQATILGRIVVHSLNEPFNYGKDFSAQRRSPVRKLRYSLRSYSSPPRSLLVRLPFPLVNAPAAILEGKTREQRGTSNEQTLNFLCLPSSA